MSERNSGPLPNRWLRCPPKSESLIAEKFLAFKTPLSYRFNKKMSSQYYFEPEDIFKLMKLNKHKIGLWVDLTNTNRFYDRRDIDQNDCKYVKLQCRGHGETPSREQTQSFIEIVDNFINEHPIEIIGVHCTHGFNRTGFLIVSYMVEKMDCAVEAALRAFADARPPGIYKEDYIKELFVRYEDDEDAIPAPPLPDWCFEDEEYEEESNAHNDTSQKRKAEDSTSDFSDDETGDTNEGESSGSSKKAGQGKPKKKKRREFVNVNATFMPGIPGVQLVTDQPRLGHLQEIVQDMCGWKSNGFPGCQPVSMDIKNVNLLHSKPYRVSWKADGTRYMMLILKENQIYFFDRDNSCFQVSNIRFPHRKDPTRHIENTLLDGEMVIDKVNGVSIPRFLAYDIVKFQNEDVGKEPFFPIRLQIIEHEIITPRLEAMKCGMINRAIEPFSIRHKMFWELIQAKALLGPKFSKALSHEPDGLIFQPSHEPYIPGRCDAVLKWKPSNLNSVDFRLQIVEESGEGLVRSKVGHLYVGQMDKPFAKIKFTRSLSGLNNKIIECKYENNAWTYMRERNDKSFPNSYTTAMGVVYSIKYPVTTERLLDYIEKYRFKDDCEAMPPPRNC